MRESRQRCPPDRERTPHCQRDRQGPSTHLRAGGDRDHTGRSAGQVCDDLHYPAAPQVDRHSAVGGRSHQRIVSARLRTKACLEKKLSTPTYSAPARGSPSCHATLSRRPSMRWLGSSRPRVKDGSLEGVLLERHPAWVAMVGDQPGRRARWYRERDAAAQRDARARRRCAARRRVKSAGRRARQSVRPLASIRAATPASGAARERERRKGRSVVTRFGPPSAATVAPVHRQRRGDYRRQQRRARGGPPPAGIPQGPIVASGQS